MSVNAATPSPQRSPTDNANGGRRQGPGLAGHLARWTPLVEDEILGLESFIAPGAVCMDVGANYGLYTHAMSRLASPGGTVHSIEPLPGAFRVLSASAPLTSTCSVRCHRIALGDRTGGGALSLPIRRGLPVHGRAFLTSGALGQGPNAEFAATRPVAVEVVTLDELCEREEIARIDFVKADVEGAELAVLHGGARTLAAHCPTLLLEIEERHTRKYGHSAEDVVAWLAARGYQMHHWRDTVWTPTDRVRTTTRNYLFLHDDQSADSSTVLDIAARPAPALAHQA